MLNGCITALVTPMFENGSIDYASLGNLLEWQIDNGISGVVANGSTGEAANLATGETLDLIKFIIDKVAGRVKIIVGAGTASTLRTLKFIEHVNKLNGIDYLMCVTPYYVKPTQHGLYLHFLECAKISQFPIVLYNVPSRTGCDLHNDTVIKLAKDNTKIVGLKDATGCLKRCLDLIERKPERFTVLSGDDGTCFAFLLLGGNGVISVASNVRPREMSQLCQLGLKHDTQVGYALNNKLANLYASMCYESNPIPVKWALFHENRITTPSLRMPLTPLHRDFHNKISDTLNLL